MSSNATRSAGGRGSKKIKSGMAEVGDQEISRLKTPNKKRNVVTTDSSAGPSAVTPSRTTASPSTTPSRSSRKKNKKRYEFDASDLWSSSDDSNDENLIGINDAKAAEAAANQLKRPPLRSANGAISVKPNTTKSVSSQSSTSSAIRDCDDFDGLSQALSSLSVGHGMSATRSIGNDASGESRPDSEPSSFEFPLYGSPTRPEEHQSLYSSAAAKIDLLHDAFSQLSVGDTQNSKSASNGSQPRNSEERVNYTDEGLDAASFLLVEVCDASIQTSLQGSFNQESQPLSGNVVEQHSCKQSPSLHSQSSHLFSDESGHVEGSSFGSSFRAVEVVDVSLQTTLPFDEEDAEEIDGGTDRCTTVPATCTSLDAFPPDGKTSLRANVSASSRSSTRCLDPSLTSETSFLHVEVVDASMQADFSADFPEDSSFSSKSQRDKQLSSSDSFTCSPQNTPLPKPFVPYMSPTGSPSLFSPKSSQSGVKTDACPLHSTPSTSTDFAFKVPLTPSFATPLKSSSKNTISKRATPSAVTQAATISSPSLPVASSIKGAASPKTTPSRSFASPLPKKTPPLPASSSKLCTPDAGSPRLVNKSITSRRESLMVKFVTPPSGRSICAAPSPESCLKAEPKVSSLDFGDPDVDDIDYEAMLQPAHDFDNSDFWSDDDDELMRTALEDLSPKSRRSVRQSLCFLSKRRSVVPLTAAIVHPNVGSVVKVNVSGSKPLFSGGSTEKSDEKDILSCGAEVDQCDEDLDDDDDDGSDIFLESSITSVSENESSATLLLKRLQNLGANASPTITTPPSQRLLPGTSCAEGRGLGGNNDLEQEDDWVVASSQNVSGSQNEHKRNASDQSTATKKSNSALLRIYSNQNSSSSSSTLSPSSQASSSLDHSSDGVAISHKSSERYSRELDDDDDDDDVILSSQKPSFKTGQPYSRSSSRKEIIFELGEEEEEEEKGDLFEDSSIEASNCHNGEDDEDDDNDTVASSGRAEIIGEDSTVASSQPDHRFETEQYEESESIMPSQLPSSKTPRIRSRRK